MKSWRPENSPIFSVNSYVIFMQKKVDYLKQLRFLIKTRLQILKKKMMQSKGLRMIKNPMILWPMMEPKVKVWKQTKSFYTGISIFKTETRIRRGLKKLMEMQHQQEGKKNSMLKWKMMAKVLLNDIS